MTDEFHEELDTQEMTEEQLRQVAAGDGPAAGQEDRGGEGSTAGATDFPLKENPEDSEGSIAGKITYDGAVPD